MKKHVIIAAQPRSGTTIFWRTLRKDARIKAYWEPFSKDLRVGFETRTDHPTQLFEEYFTEIDLMRRHWSAITPDEELFPNLIGHRENYVRALLDSHDHVVLKTTTCSRKVGALKSLAPEAIVLHLVRDPRAWTTSHLRPKGNWLPGLPDSFFSYEGGFNYWSRQRIARRIGLEGFAHEQLLQLWNLFAGAAEQQGPDLTVPFEQFAEDPSGTIEEVYELLELSVPDLDLGDIHAPRPPYAYGDERWTEALESHLAPSNRRFLHDFQEGAQHAEEIRPPSRTN